MGWYRRGKLTHGGFRNWAPWIAPQNSVLKRSSRICPSWYSNSGLKGTSFYRFSSFCSISHKIDKQDLENNLKYKMDKRDFDDIVKWLQNPDNISKWIDESLQTVPYTKRTRHILQPIPLERMVAERHFEKIKAALEGKILPPTHPDSVRVKMIAKNVIDALQKEVKKMGYVSEHTMLQPTTSHLDGLNWEVLVLNDPATNAFCIPGGKIVVFTGWLEHFRSDVEIATAIVIGHEAGHIVARHAAERHTRMLWINVLYMIIKKICSLDFVKRVSSVIQSHPCLRRMEMEADHIGLLLIASAGYDPRVVPKVYERIPYKARDFILKGSHPSGRERAEFLAQPKIMEETLMKYKECMVERLIIYSFHY